MVMFNGKDYTQEQVQAAARRAGFQGSFGGGAAENWLKSNNKWDTYVQELSSPGTTVGTYMANSVQNPTLPVGTTLVPQTMSVQPGELEQSQQIQAPTPITTTPITSPTLAPTVTGVAPTVDPNQALQYINPNVGQYQATTVAGQVPQATAQQGSVQPLATVAGQLQKLYAESQDIKNTPWAQGAIRQANEVSAARGLGNSSIAVGAMTAAIQEGAINIAAKDAATYFQMDMANLSNLQQTELFNTQLKQQDLLSDQAAENAAKQFNATSASQVQQFQAQLVSSIMTNNAQMAASMSQFNAAEQNKMNLAGTQLSTQVEMFNEQQKTAVNEFNATLKSNTDQFNANMAHLIDQSNVAWRRQINTANTSAINAANQANVQNMYNLSSYSLNALWQQLRDEASWIWTSQEKELDRQHALGLAAVGHQYDLNKLGTQAGIEEDQMYTQALGLLAWSLFQ